MSNSIHENNKTYWEHIEEINKEDDFTEIPKKNESLLMQNDS
jgi:hypothetical protein